MSPQNIFLSFLFTTVLTDRTIQLMKFLFALSPWTLVTDRLGLPSSSVTYFLHLFPHLEIISIMLLNSQRCCEDQRNDARKMFRTDPPTPPLNVCSDFSNGHYPYGMSLSLWNVPQRRLFLHPSTCHQLSGKITPGILFLQPCLFQVSSSKFK